MLFICHLRIFNIFSHSAHVKKLCHSQYLPGAFVSHYPSVNINISTVYKVKRDEEFDSTLDKDSSYCGCISRELFENSSRDVSIITPKQSASIPFDTFFAVTVYDYWHLLNEAVLGKM